MTASCTFTDAVLARHLDGDVDLPLQDTWLSGEALAEHLRDCPICRLELARARRLDAALAEASGRMLADLGSDEQRLQALLQRAVAAAAPPPPMPTAVPAAPRVRRAVPLTAAAAVFAVGFALAWTWRDAIAGPSPAAPLQAAPAGAIAADLGTTGASTAAPTASDLEGGPTRSPVADATPPAPQVPAFAPLGPRTGATPSAPRSLVPRTANEVARLAAQLEQTPAATRAREQTWQQALRALLDSPVPSALPAFALAVANLDDGWLLDDALAQARRRPSTVAALRTQVLTLDEDAEDLTGLAVVATAARIGHPELDAALRQACRRLPDLRTTIAAALRAPVRADAGAALLLDIWGDLVARGTLPAGSLGADERTARALFLTPGREMAQALRDELDCSQQTMRKIRCLLALGVTADARCLPQLLRHLAAPSQPEAMAAAWAIGELPAAELEPLRARAEASDAWLLRAALLRAQVAGSERWLERAALSSAERHLLVTGEWSLAQFPALAGLLRQHRPG